MSKREKYYGKEGFWIISVFGIMCIIFMTIYTMFIFKEVARQNMIFLEQWKRQWITGHQQIWLI